MKKEFKSLVLLLCLVLATARSDAQIPVIGQIITAVIQAIDVGVQKLQTETIYLQDAQRVVENAMSQLKLNDISSWLQKEKDLYSEYYQELWKVKSYISYYDRVKDIISKEQSILAEYNRASATFQKDPHFSSAELTTMASVYAGLLKESSENLDQINLVINAFVTQMSDAQRLKIIDDAGSKIDKNYADIMQFDEQNMMISLERTHSENELNMVKQLYGLQ
jgi:hypothetical protein